MDSSGDSSGDLGWLLVFYGPTVLVWLIVGIAVLYTVLAATAALGLTSFSMFERFRKKPREELEEGGIDDLF